MDAQLVETTSRGLIVRRLGDLIDLDRSQAGLLPGCISWHLACWTL